MKKKCQVVGEMQHTVVFLGAGWACEPGQGPTMGMTDCRPFTFLFLLVLKQPIYLLVIDDEIIASVKKEPLVFISSVRAPACLYV